MNTLVKKAKLVQSFLKTKEVHREGEEAKTIWVRTSNAPQWVTDLIRECHGDMMPDDFKYSFIVEALDAIIDNNGNTDAIDLEADIYNRELLTWLNSSLTRAGYVDEAVSEYGISPEAETFTRLGYGQTFEKREVLGILLRELEDLDLEEAI